LLNIDIKISPLQNISVGSFIAYDWYIVDVKFY